MRLLVLITAFFFLLSPAPALAVDVVQIGGISELEASSDVVPVGSVSQGGGEALVAKTNQMAGKLHSAASQIIIPIAIIILIAGGLLGIFFKAARSVAVFAILGAVLIYWAPMLVTAIINWIK